MAKLFRLLILLPAGFILAVLAAGLTVALGLVAAEPSAEAIPWVPLFTVWTAIYAGTFALVPWLVAVVVAEGFGLRSVFFWFAVGGGIGGAAYVLTDLVTGTPWGALNIVFPLAAGFVGGFVYWLVAGRSAGAFLSPSAARAPRGPAAPSP